MALLSWLGEFLGRWVNAGEGGDEAAARSEVGESRGTDVVRGIRRRVDGR